MAAPAAGGAPAAVPLGIPPNPYRDLYADATRDPHHGAYAAIFAAYDPAVNNPLQPQALHNTVYGEGNRGRFYGHVLLVRRNGQNGDGPGQVIGYHRPTRHDALLGQDNQPFDGLGLSFLGDTVHGQMPTTVSIPDDNWNQAGNVRVPTVAKMDSLLAVDPNLELVGPFANNAANTEVVSVRKICFIPNPYLLLVLNAGLSPRQAWMRIKAKIVTNGHLQFCQHLVDWLRVSLTCHGTNTDQPRTTVHLLKRSNWCRPSSILPS